MDSPGPLACSACAAARSPAGNQQERLEAPEWGPPQACRHRVQHPLPQSARACHEHAKAPRAPESLTRVLCSHKHALGRASVVPGGGMHQLLVCHHPAARRAGRHAFHLLKLHSTLPTLGARPVHGASRRTPGTRCLGLLTTGGRRALKQMGGQRWWWRRLATRRWRRP